MPSVHRPRRLPRSASSALPTLALLTAAMALAACTAKSPYVSEELPEASLHEMQPPPEAPAEPEPERAAIEPPDEAALTLIELSIDPEVDARCGPVEMPTPMFRFDSDKPTAEAAARIERLGECLHGGPLQAAQVVLIGHADPWGDGDYNRKLAERRAQQVARLLRAEGVAADRIEVQSRGERAARAEPDHWPIERRVDIAVKL